MICYTLFNILCKSQYFDGCYGMLWHKNLDFRQDLRSWASVVPAHAQKPIFGKLSELINRTRRRAAASAPTARLTGQGHRPVRRRAELSYHVLLTSQPPAF